MMHLEIEDVSARSAVAAYAVEMELLILDLLGEDADAALARIDHARENALHNVKELGSEFAPMDDDVKGVRIAIDLLESTFERLRAVYETTEKED